ncbi:putative NAD-P-binding protein [Lyophyllum shimeji]|uniref:NAD-P-binding protein n=1 Tax=Lyophyllum shimeji TaxID=47721 RepID=A0A9P3PM07_LYOSH|nr:putative NAD-P-binding protein [Lyophyllum shimeji]
MGLVLSLLSETFPPKSKFSVDSDVPDLTGRVVIVTGANTGIGKETAKVLLQHNAKVYIAARNQEKTQAAIQDLKAQTGKEALFLRVDLGDLPTIKAGAEEFLRKEKELHILFNNAGVMHPPVEEVTAQGYDLQFGTNVLGHFYLTKLLLPALLAGAKTSPDGKARVVNTSSSAHVAGSLDFNTFRDSPKRRKCSRFSLYAQSKFGNVVFANELARRYGDQGIVSTALNPGNIKSDLQRYTVQPFRGLLRSVLYCTPQGALTQLFAGTSPQGADLNGKYLVPWARIGRARATTQDPELGKQLWTWADEQVANA